ncbi:MAG TPA: sugar phosphate isomerase/epimerase family protein [Gemmataceae bacterium]|nr:sugar phosphate isomerase/epimerase family protein [Gemmataceae bacterium]
MKSAVTISLVPEARGGPFVFWDDLAAGVKTAASLGFDAVEIFPPSADAIDPSELRKLLSDYGLSLAAVGTGAGWVKHKLTLTDPDTREKAIDFVKTIIDFAGPFGAPAIIGSMQGRGDGMARRALGLVVLPELGEYAAKYNVPLLFEPLNRYETTLVTHQAAGVRMIEECSLKNVKLLCDLYHMNIEETNLADALRAAGPHVGHVHFADSNRLAAGLGHTDFGPIVDALRGIGYNGYLSAEVLPLPDSRAAAKQTIESFRKYVGR